MNQLKDRGSPATIRDVARQANVSVATASRVLNNSPSVTENTRHRVRQAMKELGYSPNPVARKLSKGRSYVIAVIMPLLLPSFVERLRGIQHILKDSQFDLTLYNVDTPEKRNVYFQNLTQSNWVDGVILISLPPTNEDAAQFLHSNVPVSLVDAWHPDLGGVYVDDLEGGYMAARHLIELGHRNIGYISDYLETPFNYVAMKRRFMGYVQALEEEDYEFNPHHFMQGAHGRDEAKILAMELLKMPNRPTAIFAASDTQAVGVLDAAREIGLSVPDDLSLIGYDNIRDADYANLTTVAQPLFQSGLIGAEILLNQIEKTGEETPRQEVLLPLQLVVRKTTGAPPA